jgi:hypothetical protein
MREFAMTFFQALSYGAVARSAVSKAEGNVGEDRSLIYILSFAVLGMVVAIVGIALMGLTLAE